MDMAIASGMAAAQASKLALENQDFSQKSLSRYEHLLKEDFVLKDRETFKRAPEFLQNERLFSLYPELACRIFHRLASVKDEKERLLDILLEETEGNKSMMILDMIRGLRAL
jgi:electron transfer flavoprotein-quinone oxidoreductase